MHVLAIEAFGDALLRNFDLRGFVELAGDEQFQHVRPGVEVVDGQLGVISVPDHVGEAEVDGCAALVAFREVGKDIGILPVHADVLVHSGKMAIPNRRAVIDEDFVVHMHDEEYRSILFALFEFAERSEFFAHVAGSVVEGVTLEDEQMDGRIHGKSLP